MTASVSAVSEGGGRGRSRRAVKRHPSPRIRRNLRRPSGKVIVIKRRPPQARCPDVAAHTEPGKRGGFNSGSAGARDPNNGIKSLSATNALEVTLIKAKGFRVTLKAEMEEVRQRGEAEVISVPLRRDGSTRRGRRRRSYHFCVQTDRSERLDQKSERSPVTRGYRCSDTD
ncbi:hypothetical protein SKAU_G00345180 [Synaphobranchus kaupii]|uniref:Uncharacterized protein n=1 Tax=Synaphobranchus kaupii TaxID=118154 RepID=A0A9Q1IGN8_SYNKA|nr:hypothetical protein SKAU_G00345180 [Synaphobranchus kaupii]